MNEKRKVDFSHTYNISCKFLQGAMFAGAVQRMELGYFAVLNNGEIQVTSPIDLKELRGSRPKDYMIVNPDWVLVSDKVVQVLKAGGFTGWKTVDVNLVDKKGIPIVGYQGLAITGRCGKIQNRKSVRRTIISPAGKPMKAGFGYFFKEKTWDGSDLFRPAGTLLTFSVSAVKEALEAAKVSNFKFTPLTEVRNESI